MAQDDDGIICYKYILEDGAEADDEEEDDHEHEHYHDDLVLRASGVGSSSAAAMQLNHRLTHVDIDRVSKTDDGGVHDEEDEEVARMRRSSFTIKAALERANLTFMAQRANLGAVSDGYGIEDDGDDNDDDDDDDDPGDDNSTALPVERPPIGDGYAIESDDDDDDNVDVDDRNDDHDTSSTTSTSATSVSGIPGSVRQSGTGTSAGSSTVNSSDGYGDDSDSDSDSDSNNASHRISGSLSRDQGTAAAPVMVTSTLRASPLSTTRSGLRDSGTSVPLVRMHGPPSDPAPPPPPHAVSDGYGIESEDEDGDGDSMALTNSGLSIRQSDLLTSDALQQSSSVKKTTATRVLGGSWRRSLASTAAPPPTSYDVTAESDSDDSDLDEDKAAELSTLARMSLSQTSDPLSPPQPLSPMPSSSSAAATTASRGAPFLAASRSPTSSRRLRLSNMPKPPEHPAPAAPVPTNAAVSPRETLKPPVTKAPYAAAQHLDIAVATAKPQPKLSAVISPRRSAPPLSMPKSSPRTSMPVQFVSRYGKISLPAASTTRSTLFTDTLQSIGQGQIQMGARSDRMLRLPNQSNTMLFPPSQSLRNSAELSPEKPPTPQPAAALPTVDVTDVMDFAFLHDPNHDPVASDEVIGTYLSLSLSLA